MRLLNGLFLALTLALSTALYWVSFTYFKAEEIEKAAARLTLYRSTLEAEIRHFAHLPFYLSLDPVVGATLSGEESDVLDHRLARLAQSAGVDAIFLIDETGLTVSASNSKSASSFKGQNYAFRPYFKEAKKGELGEFYGIGATTGRPGYFYAIAARNPSDGADGVIAIKIDLAGLQNTWQASGERIMLANSDGVVLLASNPDWRYKTLDQLNDAQRARIVETRQFANEPLGPLDWSVDTSAQTAEIGNAEFLYLRTGDLPNGWSLHFFVPDDQATTRAWLVTGTFMLLILMSFIAFQFTRVRRIGEALQRSETEEALLRQANDKLAIEIEERRAAERTLQKTQTELEQASRLAALGQLASSVTHELGQPIAAMRNQLAAAEMTTGRSPLNDKMQGLVERMENITRQLKFFSRKGRDKFEVVDLRDIVDDALGLLEPTIQISDATVRFDRPDLPVLIKANRMRIEQVMTNIIRNALDAVEEAATRKISVAVGSGDATQWITVDDTGHGLGDTSLEDLKEPFTTTRESGKGMGLGLTISAGIVSDHSGTITAANIPAGGARFRIDLPKPEGTEAP